jgi:hypothetical protein
MERSVDMGRHSGAALALAVLTLLAGCGQPSDPIGAPVSAAPTSAPADVPSPQAEMVCQPEAQADIQDLVGVVPTQVGPLQYANHVSTCRYAYPDGSFLLIVQDLPNDLTTTDAFEALAGKLGRVDAIDLPGADAFTTTDGSIVLRKDQKVMLVDVTGLPATFGSPPSPRADVGRLIMKAVLGCWTGD